VDLRRIRGEVGHEWHRVVIGLGSNIGDSEQYLVDAAQAIAPQLLKPAISSPVRSAPIGYPEDSTDFLNAVMTGLSRHAPEDLLASLKAIEQAIGRSLAPRNSPRVIDCDLLLHGDTTIQRSELTIPHPRLRERWFWLSPLAQLAPGIDIPDIDTASNLRSPPKTDRPLDLPWKDSSRTVLVRAGINLAPLDGHRC